MGKMRILDATGDTVIEWTADSDVLIREAEAIFAQKIFERQMAFARPAGAAVEEAERVYAFDPGAEEIIWVRPVQGG